jgi:hypothetical protein
MTFSGVFGLLISKSLKLRSSLFLGLRIERRISLKELDVVVVDVPPGHLLEDGVDVVLAHVLERVVDVVDHDRLEEDVDVLSVL